MSKQVDCPAAECDYGPKPIGSVKGHWGGSQDEQHQGSFFAALDDQGESTDDTANTGASGRESNPTMGSGSPSESTDKVELPCGHESIEESKIPDDAQTLTCDSCGNTYKVS